MLVLAALVPCVEALMLTCTPRSANAVVVLMQAQSDSAQLQSAQREMALMSRNADMAGLALETKDQALAAKDQALCLADQALAAKDQALAAKDELLVEQRSRTPQNHPLLGRPRVTLSCLSRAYLVRVAFAETYQKDLKLSKHVAFLHARSVVELTAAIFCRNDAKIKTHSGMVNKFLNGECAAPHACAPYAAASIAAARPPPCPINLLCSLLSSLSHPAGLQDRHPDADGGRRRHARDAG